MRVWSSLEMLSSARSFVASSSRSFFSSEERDFFEGEGVSRGDRRGWGGRRRMRVSSRVGGGRRPRGRRPRGGKRRRANRRHGRFGAPRIEIAGGSRSGEETHPRHAGDGGDLHERLVRVQLDLANLLAHAHAHGARRSPITDDPITMFRGRRAPSRGAGGAVVRRGTCRGRGGSSALPSPLGRDRNTGGCETRARLVSGSVSRAREPRGTGANRSSRKPEKP